ncbi:hypothetical protein BGW38_003073 [Lunasporangiospora selenospora]|uniref:Glycoside hydrolase family 5 C-terminal domain-containing protein n=1 Tax=Lunasporangiospora selenospora TaxID=979761 RepID=A0A9P6FT88_9FUNG|nr:hypothetical protein BGW38_003073 [Lunasporangiospora selenospora]
MPRYGIKCFIDPHQDCWSRFSGGSGAPGWTFEAAGLDITKFKATGAAYVHNTNQYPGDNPPMVWPTNYTKLAASTMFTLFWAGDTFAPNKFYCGESIQQFLQNKYIACYQHLAKRLSHLDAIIGYEVMNEPHPGYLGLKNLKRYDFNSNLFFGDFPSALESMALGDGMALPIEVWVKSWPYPTRKEKTRLINAHKESAWLEGECLWKQHGVWSINPRTGLPQVDRPNYFTTNPINGEKVNFTKFYLDFVNRYSVAIQKVVPSAFIFVEPVPNEAAPVWRAGDHEDNVVYAPHWYDLHSVFNKSFDGRITHDVQGLSKGKNVISATFFGIKGAKKNYRGQISNVLNLGLKNVGPKPCLIGECGIPMDINQRQAFMSGDYGYQSKFLDAVLSAMESNLLSFTLWNYNTTNDNTYGDHWNGEDFSIFSLDSPLSTQGLNSTEALVESRVPLREQAPNFARELAKRASVQHGGLDLTVMAAEDESSSSGSGNEEDMDTLPGQGRHSENSDDEDHTNLEDDDSPFDRSYFCFDHEGSIGGRDHKAHIGGRALDAVIRPYAAKVAGEPVSSEFDIDTLQFTFRFRNYVQTPVPVVHITAPEQLDQDICSTSPTISDSNASNLSGSTCVDPSVTSPSSEPATARFAEGTLDPALFGHPPEGTTLAFETEFFIPSYHYGGGMLEILVSDGDWRFVKERQTLYYRHRDMGPGAIHSVRIMPRREPTPLVVDGESVKAMEVRIPGSWDTRPYDGHQEAKRGETQRECIIM